MPTLADSPLRKVTLNLYEADCAALEAYYGHGWTANVREVVSIHVKQLQSLPPKPTRLEDLFYVEG